MCERACDPTDEHLFGQAFPTLYFIGSQQPTPAPAPPGGW